MEAIFKFLGTNPFLLLFLTVGLAVWVGRFSIKGYGLGMVVAEAAVVSHAAVQQQAVDSPRVQQDKVE